jgi:hypothetical protein
MSNTTTDLTKVNSPIIQPNLPIWVIPIFGALVLVGLATTKYYKAVYVLILGMIGWWLLNK